MVNSYVCYMVHMAREGLEKNNMQTHYEFQRYIALTWLELEKYRPTRYQYKKRQRIFEMGSPHRGSRSSYVIPSYSSSAYNITTMDTGNSMRHNQKILLNLHQGFYRRFKDSTLQPTGALQIRLDRSVGHWT